MLKDAIEFIYKSFPQKKINIDIDTQYQDLSVKANAFLVNLFENILYNAVKHNESQTINILIRISKENRNKINYVKMEFLDNGIGIKNDKKEILFKEGYRKLKGSKGMGLGLSLVRKIIKSLNGKIWVEDRVKGDYTKGSNFIIVLPE